MPPKLRVVKALPSNVSQAISKMSYEFMSCRDWGHSWKAYTVDIENIGRRKLFHETLLCARCDTRKHRDINTIGEILKTSYTYPAGYLIPGWGRTTKNDRAALRLAIVQILLAGEPQGELEIK